MNLDKVIIGCKAPLFAPHCDNWNEYGCTLPMGECVCGYQYDFQKWREENETK